MHFHRWGRWEDVSISEKVDVVPGFVFVRQVIRQQQRCSICNLVKTRTS